TRHIRSKGAMRGAVAPGEQPTDAVRAALAASPSMDGLDLATRATIAQRYTEGPRDARRHIVAYDYGMKRNIVRLFVQHGCRTASEVVTIRCGILQPGKYFSRRRTTGSRCAATPTAFRGRRRLRSPTLTSMTVQSKA